jgi:hypothetical protein
MPDIMGNWDRRADDPDYNPSTNQIEKGYSKRIEEQIREEKKKEAENLRKLKKILERFNLSYRKLSANNYDLYVTWGNELSGNIVSKNDNLVAEIGIKKNRRYLILTYLDSQDKFDIENLQQTIRFKELLDKNKVKYSEKQKRKEVLEKLQNHQSSLNQENEETSALINRILV